MVTDGEWKMVTYGDGAQELFDLRTDPGERHNLVDSTDASAHRFRLSAHRSA